MEIKRPFAFLIIFLSLSYSILAQDNKEVADQLMEVADEVYANTRAYNQARDAYIQVLDYDPENMKANYMAGYLYLQTINKERSVPYLLKVYETDPLYSFDLKFLIGRGYQYGLDFESALKFYNEYIEHYNKEPNYIGDDKISLDRVRKHMRECEVGKELIATPLNYNITNVGPNINSEYPDYGPYVDRDEDVMIFTSRRPQGNTNQDVFEDNFYYEDIFISKKQGSDWEPAFNISSNINTAFFESSLVLSGDGNYLYLYLDKNMGDIYLSRKISEGVWSTPEPVPGNVNTASKETSISISQDNKVIFIASDRAGTNGGIDIFYSVKDRKGIWSEVINLGPQINTPLDDDFPFISEDGKTLYFSSQGHDGMGGFDIYKTVYDSARSTWITPVNIGYPINTPDNDISFVTTKKGSRGFFSSVREGGYGYQDIYEFEIPVEIQQVDETHTEVVKPVVVEQPEVKEKQPTRLVLQVKDDSGNLMSANVKVRNHTQKFLVGINETSTGMYTVVLNNEDPVEYQLSAEKDGYMFYNQKVEIPGMIPEGREVNYTLVLRKLKVGSWTVLRNVYFDFDKAVLKEESFLEIEKLYTMLSENSRLITEISGHTDNIGRTDYNQELSYKRAAAVVKELIKRGIDPARLKAVGYGEEKPLASNDDEEEGRALNRRVEFRVLRYLY